MGDDFAGTERADNETSQTKVPRSASFSTGDVNQVGSHGTRGLKQHNSRSPGSSLSFSLSFSLSLPLSLPPSLPPSVSHSLNTSFAPSNLVSLARELSRGTWWRSLVAFPRVRSASPSHCSPTRETRPSRCNRKWSRSRGTTWSCHVRGTGSDQFMTGNGNNTSARFADRVNHA